ncbi:MAG: hypothetical protein ACPLXC_00225 [Candidatus Pacearchaeota archaeon]
MKPRVMLIVFGLLIAILSILALLQGTSITGFATVSTFLEEKLDFPTSATFYLITILVISILAIVLGLKHRKVVY